MDAALDRSDTRRPTTNTARRSRSFQQSDRRRSAGNLPRMERAGARRQQAVSTCRHRTRPRHLAHAAPLEAASSGRADTPPQLTHVAHDPPHRHTLRAAPRAGGGGAARRLRRRLDPLAAARHPRVGRSQGNINVATRAAEEIRRYVTTNAEILKAPRRRPAGHRARPPRSRIASSRTTSCSSASSASSRCSTKRARRSRRAAIGKPRVQIPKNAPLIVDGVAMSPIRVDEDLLPTAVVRGPPDAPQPAGRLARRRVQPRRNVADGRPHPHRRPRLRAGRRARTASSSRTATRTRRRSSRRRRNMNAHRSSRRCAPDGSAAPVSLEYADDDGGRDARRRGADCRRSAGRSSSSSRPREAYATADAAAAAARSSRSRSRCSCMIVGRLLSSAARSSRRSSR